LRYKKLQYQTNFKLTSSFIHWF